MKLNFCKMHGNGNDFIVLDLTANSPNHGLQLTKQQFKFLANRNFGIGADQILLIEDSKQIEYDFFYRIINADGNEVENCGNGVRCLMQYVTENNLSNKTTINVKTINTQMQLQLDTQGLIKVNMGHPIFELDKIPFIAQNLTATDLLSTKLWQLPILINNSQEVFYTVVLSMGNPHAVIMVDDLDTTDVANIGKAIQQLPAFPQQVNVGFLQVISANEVKLRVYERGCGETLSCGTGACAAVVSGILLNKLANTVLVHTCGGDLTINWQNGQEVFMSGSATTVFYGKINLPTNI